MCGIAGFYSNQGVRAGALEQMAEAIKHRGPDDEGFWGSTIDSSDLCWEERQDGAQLLRLGLAHRRLSILDLSPAGHGPMQSQNDRFVMSYNGEVYNYLELKAQFADHSFKSDTDSEVLLELFAKEGIEGLSKVNGMYAFAIYDRQEKALWLVRDPLGIKPLYYWQTKKGVFFGSEIRALLASGQPKPSLNVSLVSRYLMSNWVPDPDTLFEGIQKLEPGFFLRIDRNGIRKERFWDFEYSPDKSKSLEQWEALLDEKLNQAVSQQMRSDVPLAFFLSGGVDSSLLAAKGALLTKRAPTTFTIGFNWKKFPDDNLDLKSARILKDYYPLDYREIILEPSIVNLLPKIVDTLEEPIADPAALCSYLICQEAAKDHKVLISGQGGDELFGGYPVYLGGRVARGLQRLPAPVLRAGEKLLSLLPYSVAGKRVQSVHRIKKLLFSAQRSWPEPFFILRSALLSKDVAPILSSDVQAVQNDPFARHLEHYQSVNDWDLTQQMLYLDSKTYLPSTNLAYTDKTSMAHSVEVRVPFLDMAIVDLMARVPTRYKSKMHHSKILLKLFAQQVLPKELIFRKKAGFGLPLKDWLLNDLQPMAEDLLGENRIQRQKLFNPKILSTWLKEHRNQDADHSAKIYSLMTFQLWAEHHGVSA